METIRNVTEQFGICDFNMLATCILEHLGTEVHVALHKPCGTSFGVLVNTKENHPQHKGLGKPDFWAPGYPGGAREGLREKGFCSILAPYFSTN